MRKIPTLIGLALVIVMVGVLALVTSFAKENLSIFSKASSDLTYVLPPAVANISDTSAMVYWISADITSGKVIYGDKTAVDAPGNTHFVTIGGLKPSTKYTFKISEDNNLLEATTLDKETTRELVYGKALTQSGEPLVGAIVTTDSVVATTKSDGSYVLPVLSQGTSITITSLTGVATINCPSGGVNPMPSVKLGENISCKEITASPSGSFKVPPTTAVPVGGNLVVNLKDREIVSTPLPTISGKAGPNQVVSIVVHSPQSYSGSVVADSSGAWSWTPPTNLTPGSHTATITITNPDGTTQKITRAFFISANTPILPITSGTPSATLSHKACLNNACITITGQGTDLCLVDADCAPPPVVKPPIATPSPAPVAIVPPDTGAFENTLLLVVAGLVLITVGFGLIL